MDISYIKKIIKLVEHSSIDEIELEEEGKKIRVARRRNTETYVHNLPVVQQSAPMPMPVAQPIEQPKSEMPPKQIEQKYHEIRSPIVGTFYRAPSPDAEPYVEVGQSVRLGTVMCIVEAMKLMNEIESDCEGTVVKILVENGKPVEYNQVLFLVQKT